MAPKSPIITIPTIGTKEITLAWQWQLEMKNYIVQNSAYPNIFYCHSNVGNEILDMDTIKNYNSQMKSANWNTFEQY